MKPMGILMPYEVADIRKGRVEYGDVERVTAKRASFCRCCGGTIRKGEAALKFYWDWHGCGSWTASMAMMHAECTPATEEVRSRANTETVLARYEKLAEVARDKADNASQRKVVRRWEREAMHLENEIIKIRTELGLDK